MKRRNFLKGLFAAPAAVPAVMAEAQSMVMGSVTHPTDRLIGATPSNYWISGTKTPDSKYWETVLMLVSVRRETERIEAPSQSIARILARVGTGSLFIISI